MYSFPPKLTWLGSDVVMLEVVGEHVHTEDCADWHCCLDTDTKLFGLEQK